MQPIGLVAAMTQESGALLHAVKGVKRIMVGSFPGFSFVLSGQPCTLVTSGMGMRRAGEAARCLRELITPRVLISFGIAGAVEPDLEIGDVVVAGSVCLLAGGAPDFFHPLATWPEPSRQAMIRALAGRGSHLYTGTAVTTAGSKLIQGRTLEMMHPVLEMETAGIAQVAGELGIPLLSLRAISDGPRAPIPIQLDEMMDAQANLRVGKLLQAIFRRPGMLLQFKRLMQNTRIATINAATALVAALDGLASHP